MIAPEFYLNNLLINPPKNWRQIEIEVNFEDGEFKTEQLNINDWDFVRENIDAINAWISAGFIFEGMPFRIEQISSTGATETLFNGYIDLSKEAKFGEFGIQAKSVPEYSLDWLNDVASGFSFDYLFNQQIITQSDFIDIPYVISSIPDYQSAVIAVIGFTLVINDLSASVSSLSGAISAVASSSPDWGNIFFLIGEIIKFTVLIIASIKLLRRIIFLLIQKVKYHKGMKIKTLFERACQHLGLTFQSSIISEDEYILPKKRTVPVNPQNIFNYGVLGAFAPNEFPQFGYPDETFADFISKQKKRYNGKILFDGNIMKFERIDYYNGTPQFNLPNIINDDFTLNSDEFVSNMLISYQTDLSESNTISKFLGTSYQAIFKPQTVINQSFVLMKGIKRIDLDYALGKRKNELTKVEEIIQELAQVIDALIAATAFVINSFIAGINAILDGINAFINFFEDLGGLVGFEFDIPDIPNIEPLEVESFSDVIDDKLGMLLLEKDSFLIDKVLILTSEDYKLNTSQPTAKLVYQNYYDFEHFKQYKLKNWNGIPFTLNDYIQVKNNPRAITPDGIVAKLVSLRFNPWDKRANVISKEPYIYTNNLIKTYIETNGE
jgi:hypothetical protein